MSAMSGSRAAIFTQQSQSVEVFVEDGWWPGSILGWRHDGGGRCAVWVRVAVAGVDREVWTDLADLRLPEARPVPAMVPTTGPDLVPGAAELLPGAAATPRLSLSEAAAREQMVAGVLPPSASGGARRRRHGGDVTAELPVVADGATAGRHRA
ncbi:hypothetical protein E4P41_21540, partial [Geodermatophilus sp. DF01-2]|uniref:hypothetical protein n=1 Tax=Geodermatophilus sp. DF01-2 TaxID=2559610 RepID=UPI001073C3BC